MTPRQLAKRAVQAIALALVFVPAALCGFGRWHSLYTVWAHGFALLPGMPGNYGRAAFYKLTLRDCAIDNNVAFGTFFSNTRVTLGPNVSIGSYCVIGSARIGARCQIASHVEIPGGAHERDSRGRLSVMISGEGPAIGPDCWIGSSAVILADVGARSTIGAGAVVVKPIPADSVAVGNPARVIRSATDMDGSNL